MPLNSLPNCLLRSRPIPTWTSAAQLRGKLGEVFNLPGVRRGLTKTYFVERSNDSAFRWPSAPADGSPCHPEVVTSTRKKLSHDYPGHSRNSFGNVLAPRLDRLPLPSLSPLDDVAQTWEREVKGQHQGLLSHSPAQKLASGGHDFRRSEIDGRMPFWLLKMDRMEHSI